MGKVSVGLRGWRFDEDALFDDDGEFRPVDEMPREERRRLLRLVDLVERPCDACRLVREDLERCRQATVVYGEPNHEVLCCDDHEADFVYWYRESGGREYRGEPALRDAFHEWFEAGGRAPDDYAGVDHVNTDPDDLPEPPDPEALQRRLEDGVDLVEVDVREAAADLIEEYEPDER